MARKLPSKCLAAMIAVEALPGTPLYGGSVAAIVDRAVADAEIYRGAGVDALVLENSFDLPYVKPPLALEIVSAMEEVARAVRAVFSGPIGLQMLEAANLEAIELAVAADLDFIRVEGYVFAHIGGAGLIEGCAGRVLRRRKELGAEHIRVFGDIRKKHCAHALTADLPITEHARQAEFFLSDGHIVTGPRTGAEPQVEDLRAVTSVASKPVWIGSGVTPENLPTLFPEADGFIVGSYFRTHGDFRGRLEEGRLACFMDAFRDLKSSPPTE